MGKIKRPIGEPYVREAIVEAVDRLNQQTLAYVVDCLKALGEALLEGDLLETMVWLDAVKAMVREDAAADLQDAGDGRQSH